MWGKVIFSQVFVHGGGGWGRRGMGSLCDVTSCLAAWSHVPSRGSLSLVPCSIGGGGRWASVHGGLCPKGFSVWGGLCPGGGLKNKVSIPVANVMTSECCRNDIISCC